MKKVKRKSVPKLPDYVEYSHPDQNQFGSYVEYREGPPLKFVPD